METSSFENLQTIRQILWFSKQVYLLIRFRVFSCSGFHQGQLYHNPLNTVLYWQTSCWKCWTQSAKDSCNIRIESSLNNGQKIKKKSACYDPGNYTEYDWLLSRANVSQDDCISLHWNIVMTFAIAVSQNELWVVFDSLVQMLAGWESSSSVQMSDAARKYNLDL